MKDNRQIMNSESNTVLAAATGRLLQILENGNETTEIPDYLLDRLAEFLRLDGAGGKPEAITNVLVGFFRAVSDARTIPEDDPVMKRILDLSSLCSEFVD